MSFKSELDTIIAVIGLVVFLAGLYLWLGLPAPLIVGGSVLMYAGAKLDVEKLWSKHEPDQTTDTRSP